MSPRTVKTAYTPRELAHKAVSEARKDGRLPKQHGACVVCAQPASSYHHHSYAPEHQLDVVALCGRCHQLVHNRRIPEPVTGKLRTDISPASLPYRSTVERVIAWYPNRPPMMGMDSLHGAHCFLDSAMPVWRDVLEYAAGDGPATGYARGAGPKARRWARRIIGARLGRLRSVRHEPYRPMPALELP